MHRFLWAERPCSMIDLYGCWPDRFAPTMSSASRVPESGDDLVNRSEADERPNIWSMAVVHQYYRREFELAPRIVRDIGPDEGERQQAAAAWFTTTLAMMHHHHVTEDDLMYPLLVGRAPQALLDRMEAQHEQVAAAVDRTEAALSTWRYGDIESARALAAAFDSMLPGLVEHLDSEEDDVMPLVAAYLTAEEYSRQGNSGNEAMAPRTLMMAFGAMVEQATPYEASVMLSHPPEHVQRAWREGGAAEYRALMYLLRGHLEPIGRHAPVPALVESSA